MSRYYPSLDHLLKTVQYAQQGKRNKAAKALTAALNSEDLNEGWAALDEAQGKAAAKLAKKGKVAKASKRPRVADLRRQVAAVEKALAKGKKRDKRVEKSKLHEIEGDMHDDDEEIQEEDLYDDMVEESAIKRLKKKVNRLEKQVASKKKEVRRSRGRQRRLLLGENTRRNLRNLA